MDVSLMPELLEESLTTLIVAGVGVLIAYLRVVAARLDRKVEENTKLTREISNGQRAENEQLRKDLINAVREIDRLRTELQRYRAQ